MDIRLARVHDSATTVSAKQDVLYSVLAVDVFGTGIFHRHLVP